ncbi:MAG TPA: hypothetical protein VG269_04820 [Tepidisphaeraceae bacterium]|jgi:hypothetical protein|nr:hypothetical protein [Tepidisphaeraceae bacterium]
MKFRANKFLGLAIGERSILAAEVSRVEDRNQVTHAAEFVYTEGAGLQQPEALGAALGEFLKREGFSAKAAVFGIPARWVLSKVKEVPPIDPALAAEMLRLQVEADFSPELKDLVYDYAGELSTAEARSVLLMATPRRHVDQALAIAQAAKINLSALLPTASALASVTAPVAKNALVLSFTSSAVEFTARHDGGTSALRHLGVSSSTGTVLAGEARRAVMQLPSNGSAGSNGSALNGNSRGDVFLWDDVGVDPSVQQAVGEALGVTVKRGEFRTLGAGELPAGQRGYAAAASLALAGLSREASPVDFLNSRLAPPKEPRVKREVLLAIAVGVVVLLAVVGAYLDLQGKEKKLAASQAELDGQANRIKDAQAEVDTIAYAQAWHAGKPQFVQCFRDLELALINPDDGQTYVTNFTLHEMIKPPPAGKSSALPKAEWSGVLTGKSVNNTNVVSLSDRIKFNKRFSDVKISYAGGANRAGGEVSFSITFKYVPGDE